MVDGSKRRISLESWVPRQHEMYDKEENSTARSQVLVITSGFSLLHIPGMRASVG